MKTDLEELSEGDWKTRWNKNKEILSCKSSLHVGTGVWTIKTYFNNREKKQYLHG